jgi:DNA-binding NarL/FixJ family response regulator
MPVNAPKPIQVLVMHTEPLIEMGVVAILREQADICVQVRLARPTSAPPCPNQVDVVVTDYHSALALLQDRHQHRLPQALSGARLMVVALQHREREVRWALENGIYGYMVVHCSVADVVDGVRTVDRGARYLCQTVARCVAESLTREALTARELEVLELLARGHCNKQIASEMDVALGTVKAHMKGILGKLGAQSRMQALGMALERGLVAGLAMPTIDRRRLQPPGKKSQNRLPASSPRPTPLGYGATPPMSLSGQRSNT